MLLFSPHQKWNKHTKEKGNLNHKGWWISLLFSAVTNGEHYPFYDLLRMFFCASMFSSYTFILIYMFTGHVHDNHIRAGLGWGFSMIDLVVPSSTKLHIKKFHLRQSYLFSSRLWASITHVKVNFDGSSRKQKNRKPKALTFCWVKGGVGCKQRLDSVPNLEVTPYPFLSSLVT